MSSDSLASTPSRESGTGVWILRGTLIALTIAAVVTLIAGRSRTESTSEVVAQIHAVALTQPNGGLVGPWWVSASDLDPVGRLLNFRVEVGSVQFAAQTARVTVDAEHDTFTFEMTGVVLFRWDEPLPGEDPRRPLVEMERYTLGPIPYQKDIVP
ncbi:MAG: hypothetical protein ACYS0D_10625 [Planctomycetota bacterium]